MYFQSTWKLKKYTPFFIFINIKSTIQIAPNVIGKEGHFLVEIRLSIILIKKA